MRTGGLVPEVMVKTGVRIGTAAFALGLCLAGPQAAGVAAAEDDAGDVRAASAESVSSPKSIRPGRTDNAAVPARTRATVAPRAAAVSGSREPLRAAITIAARQGRSTLPASPVTDFLEGALLLLRRSLFPGSDIGAPSLGASAPTFTVVNRYVDWLWV